MPYIKREDRDQLWEAGLNIPILKGSGQLNFALTMLIHQYLDDNGYCYQTMNDILGALDGCAKEFYRRKVAVYEDQKIQENGDV
jgi:hypothetical protein